MIGADHVPISVELAIDVYYSRPDDLPPWARA
jgi:hypothetical protein